VLLENLRLGNLEEKVVQCMLVKGAQLQKVEKKLSWKRHRHLFVVKEKGRKED
jgi:hypothetical protein